MPPSVARAVAGCLAAAVVALAARRAGSLSTSGAAAATLTGAAAVAAGWPFGALLVLYFVVSSALSRLGAADKAARTAAIVEKRGARDAIQVLANGGVFAACALGALLPRQPAAGVLGAAALGALAAAAADTWATEIGTLIGGTPRSLLGMRPVAAGTSGAMSLAGTAAMVAGALFVALAARSLGVTASPGAMTLAGCTGALADTIVGATLQERRWCDVCAAGTERRVHGCGAATRPAGGLGRVDNDAVNLVATLVGAAAGALLAFTG